jgi:hypothetical protein
MKLMRASSSRVTVVAISGVAATALATILAAVSLSNPDERPGACESQSVDAPGQGCAKALVRLFEQGKQIFRFDTFGDEDYWGGTLQLHKAVEGAALGGVGPGVSPKTALTAAGLRSTSMPSRETSSRCSSRARSISTTLRPRSRSCS